MFTASAPGLYLFAAQCPTPPILYLRFAACLATGLAQDSRPSGSLLLSCKALSSSIFMPVYPGAHTSPSHSLTTAQGFDRLISTVSGVMVVCHALCGRHTEIASALQDRSINW